MKKKAKDLVELSYGKLAFIATVLTLVHAAASIAGENFFLRAVVGFPLFYIAPGFFLLTSLARRSWRLDELLLSSFILSTALLAPIGAVLPAILETEPYATQITFYTLIFTSCIAYSRQLGLRKVKLYATNLQKTVAILPLIIYPLTLRFGDFIPRLLTMDETSYTYLAGLLAYKGKTYGIIPTVGISEIISLIKGRYLWTTLIASFITLTGYPPYKGYLISAMFLPMISLAALLLADMVKGDDWTKSVVFILTFFNPMTINFSFFALNDLFVSFMVLSAITFFIGSIEDEQINVKKLISSILVFTTTLFVKENIVPLFPIYFILVTALIKWRLYEINKAYKIMATIMILVPLTYELVLDIPYNIALWFLKNEELVFFIRKFLPYSITGYILGIFLPIETNKQTILSYKPSDYLRIFYNAFQPEWLSLPVSCLLYTSPSPRDLSTSRMPSSA